MPADSPISHIVVGVDGSPGSQAAMAWCASLAASLGARVTAVSVVDPPEPVVPLPQGMRSDLADIRSAERAKLEEVLDEQWCEPLRAANVDYTAEVRTGKPAPTLADLADSVDADLLVVGRRGYGRVIEAVVGSVPHALAHHAKRPLVIVPQ